MGMEIAIGKESRQRAEPNGEQARPNKSIKVRYQKKQRDAVNQGEGAHVHARHNVAQGNEKHFTYDTI